MSNEKLTKAEALDAQIMVLLNEFMRETGERVAGISLRIHDLELPDGTTEPVCIGITRSAEAPPPGRITQLEKLVADQQSALDVRSKSLLFTNNRVAALTEDKVGLEWLLKRARLLLYQAVDPGEGLGGWQSDADEVIKEIDDRINSDG